MRITMLTAVAARTEAYQSGHTYDVADALGAELKRAGHARDAEGIEDPDVVITRKPGRPRKVFDAPGPTVTVDRSAPPVTADAARPTVAANAAPNPPSVKPPAPTTAAK